MKKLTDIRKNEEMYKVPENYFDEFQARMSDITAEETSYATAPARSGSVVRLAYAIPALVVLLVAGIWAFNTEPATEDLFADISTADLIEFLEEEGLQEVRLSRLSAARTRRRGTPPGSLRRCRR